jgi:hypothetical protein
MMTGVWTHEWQPFTGYYEKEMVDIKLKTGEIIHCCWPNAGFMNPLSKTMNPTGLEAFPYKNVAEVKLTSEEMYNDLWDGKL